MPFEVIALFVPIVSIVFKKNKRVKNQPSCSAFYFLFPVIFNCLFPKLAFSQIVFIPIVFSQLSFSQLVFSNCILYIGFSQLYCVFPQLSLFSSRKLSYKEDGTCGAFLYDVDKGAGGVKLYMLWLFRGQRHGHDAAALQRLYCRQQSCA